MATGYEDIDNLMEEQNKNLEQQKQVQNEIIDKGITKQQNEVNRQKEEYEREADKTAKGLYADYKKQSNPYGASAETLASQGLNKSGYAESTQTNLYNSYQKNVTELSNKTRQLKADADFQMNQAYLDADIQKAQSALSIYQQQADLAMKEYDLRFTREQFDYQKERDRIADEQWEKQYQLSLQQANQSQSNWEREYQLSLQKSKASNSRSSSGGSYIELKKDNGTTTSTKQNSTTVTNKLTRDLDFNDRVRRK